MKLTEKFVLAMALVVTLAVSVGGTILLAVQFQSSFQNAVAQDSSRHILARYSLESKVLADRMVPDRFAQSTIGNIYYDTPDFRLIRRRGFFNGHGVSLFRFTFFLIKLFRPPAQGSCGHRCGWP